MRMSELWADTAHLSSLPPEEDIKRAGEILLRDQFAMAALTGLLNSGGMSGDPLEDAAEAYEYADAMLKAREAK